MCNQNIISNKFDLKLVTTFSSYWCTAIFTKSRFLHYVLKKHEEINTKVNLTTLKKETMSGNITTLTKNSQSTAKISESKCRKEHTQGRNDASRTENDTQRQKSIALSRTTRRTTT
jgi:hypothetical protein